MKTGEESTIAARVSLILQQIEALPTLSPVAIRVLELAGSSEAEIEEIVEMIESDPSLSAKLLAMCRRADRGLGAGVQSIDRAVVLLGLDAVRAAVLSFEVFEALEPSEEEEVAGLERASEESSYERAGLWRYLVATACASELLAERHQLSDSSVIKPEEAFLCGLLHDLGKLAMDRVLPRAFAKCAFLAEQKQCDISSIERQVLGTDHHAAGRQLAGHWGLPQALQDVMLLHDHPAEALPNVEHRELIGLVGAASAIARSQHIGWSGNFLRVTDLEERLKSACLKPAGLEQTIGELHERVAKRAELLGLDQVADRDLLLQSVIEANRKLGRMAELFEDRSRRSRGHASVLEGIGGFLGYAEPPRSLASAWSRIARSAGEMLGAGVCVGLIQPRAGSGWQCYEHNGRGESVGEARSIRFESEADQPDVALLARSGGRGGELMSRLSPMLCDSARSAELHALEVLSGWGPSSVLLLDVEPASVLRSSAASRVLVSVWASVLGGATQQASNRSMSDDLAEATRRLSSLQRSLVDARSLARLGELAAGAAHEMNNPLTVISGKSQILAGRLMAPDQKKAIGEVIKATTQLSKLIDGLHFFASPPQVDREEVDITTLLKDATAEAIRRFGLGDTKLSDVSRLNAGAVPEVVYGCEPECQRVYADPKLLGIAVTEIVLNAFESGAESEVVVEVQPSVGGGRLEIVVTDDGQGLSDYALEHACDPFFSEKEAGRQSGLGLAKALRVAELHGGVIELSRSGRGSRVALTISEWEISASGRRQQAA